MRGLREDSPALFRKAPETASTAPAAATPTHATTLPDVGVARHARANRAGRIQLGFAAAAVAALVLGSTVAVTSALAGPQVDSGAVIGAPSSADVGRSLEAIVGAVGESPDGGPDTVAPPVASLPVPGQQAAPAAVAICDEPAVVGALSSGTDADVIAAVGGGEEFRAAIATGTAPCLNLTESARTWVVVNKTMSLAPVDYAPAPLAKAEGVRDAGGGHLRADAAAALTQLAAAASAEGAGTLALNSGYRPYTMQVSTYDGYVRSLGADGADLTSARPGYSEHQTGLAADVVACSGSCGGLETFAGTAQAAWVAENSWRYGYVVRYEDGQTATTGYEWEPWHLRYIGTDLAAAYHDGGFHSLEAFFALPASPDYVD